jgi:hypothetical protein
MQKLYGAEKERSIIVVNGKKLRICKEAVKEYFNGSIAAARSRFKNGSSRTQV